MTILNNPKVRILIGIRRILIIGLRIISKIARTMATLIIVKGIC
jgi:hypothetical protein